MKKKRLSPRSARNSLLLIILCVVLLLIPVGLVASQIFEAYRSAGKPMFGDRFKDDLVTKISSQQLKDVEANILANVTELEKVEIHLQSSLVKVSMDVKDDVVAESYPDIVNRAYAQVIATLPLETYFTKTETARNYDLQMSAVNSLSGDVSIHGLLTKNSQMTDPLVEMLSTPRDQATVDKIRAEQAAREAEQQAQQEAPADTEQPTTEN